MLTTGASVELAPSMLIACGESARAAVDAALKHAGLV
jgi:hypothetical protein